MPRRGRRRAGTVRLAATALSALVLTACGGVGQPATYDATGVDGLEIPTPSPDPADFVDEVDNPWLPLPDGRSWRYVVEQDGARVGGVRAEVVGREEVAGVEATVVVSSTRVAGELSLDTRYYAQDEAGNVWLLGEHTGTFTSSGWRAGEDGAQAGLAMPAEPRQGDGWLRASVPGSEGHVVQVTEPLATDPAGVTGATVWLLEEEGDGVLRRTVYESGVGLVESVEADGGPTTTLVR